MGIPVSINLNALEFMSQGEKRIQQLGPFKVVTFSTHFYSYGDILAKRFLDICGALVGLVLCGMLESSFIHLFVKMVDQLSLLKTVWVRMDVSSSFINSVL